MTLTNAQWFGFWMKITPQSLLDVERVFWNFDLKSSTLKKWRTVSIYFPVFAGFQPDDVTPQALMMVALEVMDAGSTPALLSA